mgnify:CR=1 FL=1
MTPIPYCTLTLLAAAGTVLVVPGAAQVLMLEREALNGGELWRLLSAHLVHYSWAHFGANLLVLAPAAWLVETRDRRDFLPVVLLAALMAGLAVYLAEPGVKRFAGASALAFALLTYAALRGLRGTRPWRLVCVTLLALVLVKTGAELMLGWQPVDWRADGFVAVPLSHAAGIAAGTAVWLRRTMLMRAAGADGVAPDRAGRTA